MRLIGPDHIVLVSSDPERLVAWYAERLNLEVLRLEEWRRQEVLGRPQVRASAAR